MPKLNVQQNNQNVIQAFRNALAIGNLKGIIASDGNHNFSAAGSNRNLLDNGWLQVNQRAVSGTLPNNAYGLDRWKYLNAGAPSLPTLNADGTITFTLGGFYFYQPCETALFDYLTGKTVTYSAIIDGEIYSATFTFPSTGATNFSLGTQSLFARVNTTSKEISFYNYGGSGTINLSALKLELGSVSTLANDAPPDYDKELDHCKWYFERIKAQTTYSSFGNGFGETTTSGQMQVPMHQKRTVTYTVSTSGSFILYNGAQSRPVSALSKATSGLGQNVLCLAATATSLVQGSMYALLANNDASAYIDISADL